MQLCDEVLRRGRAMTKSPVILRVDEMPDPTSLSRCVTIERSLDETTERPLPAEDFEDDDEH